MITKGIESSVLIKFSTTICSIFIANNTNFNTNFKTISSEMSAVTGEMTAPWNETKLRTFTISYKMYNQTVS